MIPPRPQMALEAASAAICGQRLAPYGLGPTPEFVTRDAAGLRPVGWLGAEPAEASSEAPR